MMRLFSSRSNEPESSSGEEPARKMRKLSSASSLKATGQTAIEFGALFVDIPKDSDMSERDLKEYMYETYKEEILEQMRLSPFTHAEEVTVSTDESSSTRRTSLDGSYHSSHSETLQELTFVQQRLELLQKVAVAQKQYLQCEGPKVVYTYLLEGLLDLVDSEFGFIGEVKHDEDGRMYLHVHRATNIAWDEATKEFYEANEDNLRFYNMDTLFGRTLLEKKPILSNERATKTPPGHPFIEAFMGIPFFSETNEVIGMLGVANKPGGYDSADVEFLDPFTATCGNIIQSYRQIEKNKDLIDTLELKVHERTKALESTNQELAAANHKVIKAKEMQLQHFACMSHEIRTPLNGIVGLLSLLQDTELSPSQQESINLIVSSSDLLSTVVNDVLDYSKLETGHVDFKIQRSPLQDTLNSILHSFRTRAATKNISLVTDFDTSVPTHIDTDTQRLQQCLFNLLGNAIKFSEENSKVELRVSVNDNQSETAESSMPSKCPMTTVRKSDTNKETLCPVMKAKSGAPSSGCPFHKKADNKSGSEVLPAVNRETLCPVLKAKAVPPPACPFHKGTHKSEPLQKNDDIDRSGSNKVVRFVVKDYGRGIKSSELSNIFQPFKQANSETEAEFGGTGLGLAITDKLARGLGGKLSAKSRIGEFSEFTIDIPLLDAEDAAPIDTIGMPVYVVHHSDDDEEALHLKNTFESSRIPTVVFKSMEHLLPALERDGLLKTGQPYACICNESLYDQDCYNHLAQESNVSLLTFGPDFLARESNKHFPFLSHTLPSEILEHVWKAVAAKQGYSSSSSCSSVSLSAQSSSASLSTMQSSPDDVLSMTNANLRVLVAEDNKINRKVISNILTRIGVTKVTLVENGKLAVEAEASNVYDVILMDMCMPIMGGVEACRTITSRARGLEQDKNGETSKKAPIVVFVTANVSPSFEKECNEAGGKAFLPKPFNVKKLEAMFDTVREQLRWNEGM